MLEDGSGGYSTTRVVLTLWLLLLCICWSVIAVRTQSIPDIPQGVLALTGMLLSAKVVQRFGEKESSETNDSGA